MHERDSQIWEVPYLPIDPRDLATNINRLCVLIHNLVKVV